MHLRVLLFVIAALAWTPTLRAQQPLTLRDLARAVSSARDKIHDLTVSFTFHAAPGAGPSDNLFAHSHMTVTAQGEKLSIDHTYAKASDSGPVTYFHRITSYDGESSFIEMRNTNGATSYIITYGREREINTNGLGFFDIMMFNPTAGESRAREQVDLVALLKSPNAVLRPDLEAVDGRECYVVDAPPVTVWLDPSRGYLPIRQRHFIDTTPPQLSMEMTISEAAQIAPGLWMPLAGRKDVGATLTAPSAIPAMSNILAVEKTAAGAPAITLNLGVHPQVFNPSAGIPPGAIVVDGSGGYTIRRLMLWLAIAVTVVLVIIGAAAIIWRDRSKPETPPQSST